MTTDIKESANINSDPRKKKQCYIILRNYGLITFFKKYWNKGNVYDKITTIEELKEALKN
jgi:hypothetical protein